MFGFGRRGGFGSRRPGLMSAMFGWPRSYGYGYQRRRGNSVGGALGRMALIGGLSWLGGRIFSNRSNQGGFSGGNSGGFDSGTGGSDWGDNNGQSW